MGHFRYDPAMQSRPAWNAGKTVGTKRPLTQKQIWAGRFFLDREVRLRDRALFDLAIDSKLRGCDLVKMISGRGDRRHLNDTSAKRPNIGHSPLLDRRPKADIRWFD